MPKKSAAAATKRAEYEAKLHWLHYGPGMQPGDMDRELNREMNGGWRIVGCAFVRDSNRDYLVYTFERPKS